MSELTQAILKSLLTYDPETGVFTYALPRPKVKVGGVAGHLHKGHGYIQMKVQGRLYLAHRLAWLYVYGEWPENQLDHINRNRADNRLSNLRPATNAENCQNRPVQKNATSGVAGVTWNKTLGKWHARISVNNRRQHVGWFRTRQEAVEARRTAELALHPYRTG